MNTIRTRSLSEPKSVAFSDERDREGRQADRPLVSLVVPAFNEAAIIRKNLSMLCEYMKHLECEYRWEIILVDDGSRDETGKLAEAFAKTRDNIFVVHHPTNFGLGQALKSGFNRCKGDYVVVLDLDLSYSPDHIQRLLTKIRETRAKIVVTSPYSRGGIVSDVPWLRLKLSIWANRFLSMAANCNLSTVTGMVRAYDGKFIRSLNLRALGMDVNPEVIYKGMLLRARIEEIPAHLDWKLQNAEGIRRKSSMKVLRHILSTVLSGFIFRPFMFFILPGLALLVFAVYVNVWMFVHFFAQYQMLSQYTWFFARASAAVGAAYSQFPHTFIVGLLSLMLAIQLISLGILALQSKNYFEEIFHLGSTIYKSTLESQRRTHE